jgi:hypothetical protein
VIEDSLPGVTAAVAAGMTAIGFTAGSHCRPGHDSRLLAQGAALAVGSMAELLSVLTRPVSAAGPDQNRGARVCDSAPSNVPPNASSG